MKITAGLVFVANVALFILLAWAADHGHIIVVGELKPFDLASLALVAATLVVTGVGVFAALLAVWGYKEIREASVKAATTEATKVATKVATDTAESVAARTSLEAPRSGTSSQEAGQLVEELKEEDLQHGA